MMHGVTPEPRAGQRVRGHIDRAAVVARALAIADRDGLPAVSMRTLAHELGVAPMALYRHVSDKDDLLDALIDALLTEIELPAASTEWRRDLRDLAHALRAAGHRHPAVFPLLVSRPVTSVAAHRPVETLLAILDRAGISPRGSVHINHVVTTYILGFVVSELSGRFAPGTISASERLARLPADDFPAHRRAAKHLVDIDWSREFDAGLDLLIDMVENRRPR